MSPRFFHVPNFRNILVDIEAKADQALKRAASVAHATGAKIKLVDVVEGPPSWIGALAPRKSRIPQILQEDCKQRLEELAQPLRDQSLPVETKVLLGKVPSVEIVREVLRFGHDLVIKLADTGRPNRFFESTPDIQLLRKCPCPLWLVKPRRASKQAVIVAAIAPSPGETEMNVPNAEIMEAAINLAELQGCELHVVRAWRAYGEGSLRSMARIQETALRDYLAATRQQIHATLKTFLTPYSDSISSKHIHLLKGHPGEVIPNFAKTKRVAIVVVGSGYRKGMSDVLIGTTTQRIIDDVACSIFAVKPKNFVTPVKVGERE